MSKDNSAVRQAAEDNLTRLSTTLAASEAMLRRCGCDRPLRIDGRRCQKCGHLIPADWAA